MAATVMPTIKGQLLSATSVKTAFQCAEAVALPSTTRVVFPSSSCLCLILAMHLYIPPSATSTSCTLSTTFVRLKETFFRTITKPMHSRITHNISRRILRARVQLTLVVKPRDRAGAASQGTCNVRTRANCRCYGAIMLLLVAARQ